MGVHGLASFMEEKFKGWKPIKPKDYDRVIIDGNNVCYKLYSENFAWALGGEYGHFRDKVREYFDKSGFKEPIVVLDGPDDPQKEDLIHQRRNEYIEKMSEITDEGNGNLSDKGLVPLLALHTFISVLKEKNIKFYVADGEADREIVALANHYKCPVVSSDSDFFIFNLKYGFIYANKQLKYVVKSFMKEFDLLDYDICLLIPVVLGNDFLKKPDNFVIEDLSGFLKDVSGFGTRKAYTDSIKNKKINDGYLAAKSFYTDIQLPDYYKSGAPPEYYCRLPAEWIYFSFKSGNFSVGVMGAYRYKFCALPRVVEATKNESAWRVSRHIRERIYHIMNIRIAVEVIRKNCACKVVEEKVDLKSLPDCTISVKDNSFQDEHLVLTILCCHDLPKSEFSTLPDELKLPIAATFYWYRNTKGVTKEMVIALLLNFMEFNVPESLHFDHESPLSHITPSSNYLAALHVFAQWQCVYYDAMSLNFLAREPFLTTSPACLYSGEILMLHVFVSSKHVGWPGSIIPKGKDWELFSTLLYLVTGRKEARKAYCVTSPI